MNEYGLYAMAYAVFLLLFFYLKSYRIRKWLGIALVALGGGGGEYFYAAAFHRWLRSEHRIQPMLSASGLRCFLVGRGMRREPRAR